ncbi:hypothetical protein SAMN05443245_0312 [Paraburkholderia fungorum]|uniref:SH3 domain-containing protein n=1 Tax=Paraburkholderia fungorum TaxID=134537 RepID=A0A1H0YVZ6_9BURK|nr:hypothetical protein [Paraburkholderia fungorum]SDQ19362.1 hypothetical protein SAMN05443245_0312 [Paraburkholderia fungorum]
MSRFRIGFSGARAVRVGAVIASALLLTCGAAVTVFVAEPSSTFRFALPGGAAIFYSSASNPQAPLPERTWRQAVFHFPNGATFSLLPGAGKSNAGGTEIEPPSETDISPSGQYVVIGRVESGTVSSGPGQAESVLSREYCSVIEIRTGCITADQTGEICGAGWQAGQPAQWGKDEDSNVMLKRDRPSVSRLLRVVNAGQPARLVIDDDSGADNLLRCDPPSPANRESYQKIAAALHTAGAHNDARLIDAAFSNAYGDAASTPAPAVGEGEHRAATISATKATLYMAPDDAQVSRAYLVRDDVVTVLKQSPSGWAYVDYVGASGKHLLRWIRADQIAIKP